MHPLQHQAQAALAEALLASDVAHVTCRVNEWAEFEGWAIFDLDANGVPDIQRIDEAEILDSDAEALDLVERCAAQGSKLHLVALALHHNWPVSPPQSDNIV